MKYLPHQSKFPCAVIAFWLFVLMIACQPFPEDIASTPPVLDNTKAENIYVKTTAPTVIVGNIEQFPLPNCGGTGELTQTLGTQASVSKNVTLGGTATTIMGAEVAIPEAVRAQLEIQVEISYQQTYETANDRLDTIEMKAAAGTHVIYDVQWEKQEFSSNITYELDREILTTPYIYILNVPKIANSHQTICPTIGAIQPPTAISPEEGVVDTNEFTEPSQIGEPLRQHYQVVVGDGIFESGTFSDGFAELSEQWLWDNNHFDIQRIRQEEYPSGCDVSRYNTNLVWIGGSSGMKFTINGETVGTYTIAPDPHGYVFEWSIYIGDVLCAVGYSPSGYHIILGPDVYYHYDSYCYRGGC